MNGWTITRVWEIDEHLIVAPTIEDAVALFKTYMGKDSKDEPYRITAISNSVCCGRSYTAFIKEEKPTGKIISERQLLAVKHALENKMDEFDIVALSALID